MPDIVDLTYDTGQKILGLIATSELSPDGLETSSGFANHLTRQLAIVLCGDLVDSSNKIYSGTPRVLNTNDLSYTDFDPCYLYNSTDLTPGSIYLSSLYGERTVTIDGEDDTRNLWWAGSGSGKSTKVLRIVDTFVNDGFWCFWPAVEVKFVPGSATPWQDLTSSLVIDTTDGTNGSPSPKPVAFWVVNWFNYGNDIVGDGTSARLCQPEGVSYDPTHGSWGTSYNLPIYSTSQYAALISDQCEPTDGGPQPVGTTGG